MTIINAADIKAKASIEEIISEYIILKPKGRNIWGLCPFHNEKTPSFSVNPAKQMFHCFGCNAGGDVIDFIMKYHGIDFKTAKELLAARAGIKLDTQSQDDYRRIQEAQKQRNKEKELAGKLQAIIDAEIKRLINLEKWIHRVTQLIQTPEILDLPVISWAVKQKEAVSFFLDELMGTDDAAEQLVIVRLSREVIAWKS